MTDPTGIGPVVEVRQRQQREVVRARRRAALVAAVAGLVLVPSFQLLRQVADLSAAPPFGAPTQGFVDFYAENASRLPLNATLFTGQWIILLVLVVAVVRAACTRLDLAAILAVALAGAATAIYVCAEGVRVWPVLAAGMSAAELRDGLDPGLAQAAVLSRDGLHAPAAVLLGSSVLIAAWLLARSDLWGRWVMAGLSALGGAFALSSVLVGPDGFGPGLIIVVWAPVTAVLLLAGWWRTRAAEHAAAD